MRHCQRGSLLLRRVRMQGPAPRVGHAGIHPREGFLVDACWLYWYTWKWVPAVCPPRPVHWPCVSRTSGAGGRGGTAEGGEGRRWCAPLRDGLDAAGCKGLASCWSGVPPGAGGKSALPMYSERQTRAALTRAALGSLCAVLLEWKCETQWARLVLKAIWAAALPCCTCVARVRCASCVRLSHAGAW